jgi:hypothetical protein
VDRAELGLGGMRISDRDDAHAWKICEAIRRPRASPVSNAAMDVAEGLHVGGTALAQPRAGQLPEAVLDG